MLFRLTKRFITEPDKRLLLKFACSFGWKGMLAVNRFKRRNRKGERFFPAFMMLSITNKCNLKCQGCWVTQSSPAKELSLGEMRDIVNACREHGSFFFGILGGEPLMHSKLMDLISSFPDCYFQVFTNGTMLDRDVAREFRRLGNVTPLISIEGLEEVSDSRRGGCGVYIDSLQALENCRAERLITGVATSVCRSNIDELINEKFVDEMISRGVLYLWYYIYRPVGPRHSPELVLTEDEVLRLRKFLVDARCRKPVLMVDTYWDAEGRALCPGAVGMSHHINPYGDIEFCPPIQFAKDSIRDTNRSLKDILAESDFLEEFRELASSSGRGCIILDNPGKLGEFLNRHDAKDASGRGAAYSELAAMSPCVSHDMPGKEIPEKHFLYRFAKKHWFFGFGAYG